MEITAIEFRVHVMAYYKWTMARLSIIAILTILSFIAGFAQTKNITCDCPKNHYAETKADTTFYLSNGKTIVLCGYKNPGSKPTNFSEFILAVCGQDTIIDFWGAIQTCRLKVNKDTLYVEQIENLPLGKNFKYQETVWTSEKIYFRRKSLNRKLTVNRQINKYNPHEIKQVLKSYETAKPGLDDNKMKIANELFIAIISGNKTARQYFKEFYTKFGILDGAYMEEYNDLTSMLILWDKHE